MTCFSARLVTRVKVLNCLSRTLCTTVHLWWTALSCFRTATQPLYVSQAICLNPNFVIPFSQHILYANKVLQYIHMSVTRAVVKKVLRSSSHPAMSVRMRGGGNGAKLLSGSILALASSYYCLHLTARLKLKFPKIFITKKIDISKVLVKKCAMACS